jgi:hypothetical protein
VKSAQYSASQQMLTTSANNTCIDVDTTQNDSDSKNFEPSDHHATFGSPTNVIL